MHNKRPPLGNMSYEARRSYQLYMKIQIRVTAALDYYCTYLVHHYV